MEHFEFGNPSFLRARDPSIIRVPNWNRVVANLEQNYFPTSTNEDETITNDEGNHLKVLLRIKNLAVPDNLYEIDNKTLTVKMPSRENKNHELRKVFEFTKIFGPEASQEELFNSIVKIKMLNYLNGTNSSILTYGASGSGKTFTLHGTEEAPGLLPRALEYLFKAIPSDYFDFQVKPVQGGSTSNWADQEHSIESTVKKFALTHGKPKILESYLAMQRRLSTDPAPIIDDVSDVKIGIWVTFAEIYNEAIFDLLNAEVGKNNSRRRLALGNANGTCYIKGLVNVPVRSGVEAYQLLQYGLQNLCYAETKVNQHSSRSHAIFTLKMVMRKKGEKTLIREFNFCDLAGSERSKRTQNVGARLQESNNINTSLLVLGRCIEQIKEAQHTNKKIIIPFRDSKLTQVFKKALSGFEDISMIVTLNPIQDMFDESQHVLNFSAIAKTIEVKPQVAKNSRLSSYFASGRRSTSEEVEHLRNLVHRLEQQLLEADEDGAEDRSRISAMYQKLLEDERINFEHQLKRREELLNLRHEIAMENLRRQYEKNSDNEDDEEVIDLTDDADDIVNYKQRSKELKLRCDEQEKLLQRLRDSNLALERKNEELANKVNKLNEEIEELELTLEDARHLEEENCKLVAENFTLKSRLDELEEYQQCTLSQTLPLGGQE